MTDKKKWDKSHRYKKRIAAHPEEQAVNPRPSQDKFHPSVVLTKEDSFQNTFATKQAH